MSKLRVLVIVPLIEERDYFHETIKPRPGWTPPTTGRIIMEYGYQTAQKNALVAVRTIKKMGHLEAALALNSAANLYSPHLIILLGLAGSMEPDDVGLGDVVVSNQVKAYSIDKIGSISQNNADVPFYKFFALPPIESTNGCIVVDERDRIQSYSYARYNRDVIESTHVDGALSSLEMLLTDAELIQVPNNIVPQRFEAYKSFGRNRTIQYGWILGSQHVVDSREYRDYLNNKNGDEAYDIHRQLGNLDRIRWSKGKLLAVDMESYGILRAVEQIRTLPPNAGGSSELVGGIIVRGISDLAEAKSQTDRGIDASSKNEARRIAVSNAAEVAAQIVERMDYSYVLHK